MLRNRGTRSAGRTSRSCSPPASPSYTTVNVQHLESLNDIVRQITGVIVRETLPDSFLDRADEIELIDLPPDDLLQRLKEGKVYIPEQAEKAMEHFFRKGNLIALRELALRRTAEQVDEQMESYRRDAGVQDIWPAAERILVCIGPNPRSIRLIRAARRMAAGLRAEWIARACGGLVPHQTVARGLEAPGGAYAACGKPGCTDRHADGAQSQRGDP